MLELLNEEFNFMIRKLKLLEEAYKQSVDHNVRLTVKEKVFFDLCENINEFYKMFEIDFENCKMSSLREILELIEKVIKAVSIVSLPEISSSEAKKVLKLKGKQLSLFVKKYNEVVKNEKLTYYSTIIDNKFIMLTYKDGEYYGVVSIIPKNIRIKKNLCCFCKQFRDGDEIMFIQNVLSNSSSGKYNSIGQYCCSDYKKCNNNIENSEQLIKFLSYDRLKNKVR
ncbi:MAG: hypothetical protein GX951_03985 [Mollicutes bacterium]|nr:hypothetical protein [Mollicutes bacterium]